MKIKLMAATLLIFSFFFYFSSPAQGNLIINGSFENGGGSFSGWTGTFMGDVVLGPLYTNAPAIDGAYFAGFRYSGGTLSQAISTIPNTYYALNFLAVQFQGTNNVSVNVNGSLLATLSFSTALPITYSGYGPYDTNWNSFSYVFETSSNLTTLVFNYYPQIVQDGNDLFYGSGGLDAISVMAVPEPSNKTLLGIGLIGGLARRWRSVSKIKFFTRYSLRAAFYDVPVK